VLLPQDRHQSMEEFLGMKKKNLWQAEFYNDGKKQKSYFDNEVDAAKKLNMVHDKKTEILPQDTTISEILNQQKKGKKQISIYRSNLGEAPKNMACSAKFGARKAKERRLFL